MKRLKVYGLTCALFLVAALANATTIVMPDDEQLIGKTPVIVEGRVVSTAAVEHEGRIWTETVVAVDRTLKGTTETTIVVREIGGELDGRITKIYGTPEFKEDERVLLFLEQGPHGYRTMDLFVGKFRGASMADGRKLWLRNDAAERVTLLDHDFQPIAATNVQRDAAKFEQFVADRVAGRAGVKNYGIANPVLAADQISGRRIESNFTLISEPTVYRWFMFDNGQTANWYSGGTQSGYTNGGVTELQSAMIAWTSYNQAKILMAYAGTRASSFGGLSTRNSVNEVLFDDPLSEIAGTFARGAGGVVGTGGFNGVTSGGNWASPFAFDADHPQGTMRAYNIVEGNLTIQDGVTPGNGIGSSRLAEIISHEFGHTLGFGHSPDPLALMYATVTGRGPNLKEDDQIGARWLYPNGNVAPPPPQVPAAPSAFSAIASVSTLTLEWFDNSNNETGFSIFMSTNGGAFSKVTDVAANSTRAKSNGIAPGTYRLYVLAFNANGNSGQSNTATITVAGTTLTAAFSFSPQTGTAGVTQFTFYDESRGASTRRWDFGDGTSSTAAVANKTYSRSGRFTVSLTVTGASGNTAQASQSITVSGPLAVSFSFSPANPTVNDPINFVDDSTGGITSWRWVFGDGETSTAQNPSKQYGTASTYTVTLTVFRNSESASVSKTITVKNAAPVLPPVVAAFDFLPSSPLSGADVTFTDRSTGSPAQWSWSFGDGRTSTAQNPVISFASPGNYNVSLTASNGGNSATISRLVSVVANTPHRSLVSVTTQTNGVGGTAWRTELSVFNAGSQGVNVNLLFLPGAGGSVISRSVFLSPQQSVTYTNTLFELFGVPNGAGAVAIEGTSAGASAQLRVSSRTYTNGVRGTYGQAVPDVVSLDKTLYITGMQQNASFRTNLGLVNRGTSDMAATLTLYNASGTTLATANVTVPARNFQQASLSTFFPEIAGRSHDILSMRLVAASAEAISAYASVLDNETQDPIYVQAVPATSDGSLTLPVVGRSLGVNGTFWRSDVAIFNPTSSSLNLSIRYGNDTKSFALGARDTTVLDDVLSDFGLTAGQGALTLTWTGGTTGPIVTSRTYTSTETTGTFGQSIDPIAAFSNDVYVPGLRSDTSYRSNVGFVNGGTDSETFSVIVLSPFGTELASVAYTLTPGAQAQASITSLFPGLSQSTGNFTLALRGDGNAKLFAYGSMVDNMSGDPVFFAGR